MDTMIILIVLALMVIAMMTDKFEFGVAPMVAVVALALTGVVTMQEAFAGFTNKYVIVTAAFLVISVVFSRTQLITRIQQSVMNLQKGKSGMLLFLMLILFTLVVATLMQPGPAALLMVIVLTTIPANEKPAMSQMMLPLGTLCNLGGAKLPIGTTLMFMIWINGFLEKAGFDGQVSITRLLLMGILPLIVSVGFALFAYRLLPKHTLNAAADGGPTSAKVDQMSKTGEILVYLVFGLSTLAMFFSNRLGDLIFLIPVVGVVLLVLTGVLSFKETRSLLSHELVFLLAGIFALSDIMANKGISAMIGASIQHMMGGTSSGWLLMFIFAFTAVIVANITGSNVGTMMIISPVAVSTAMAANIDPRAIVMAVVASAAASVIMPMDTAMAVVFARGNYKLSATFLYTIPLTILYIVAICLSAGMIYPM